MSQLWTRKELRSLMLNSSSLQGLILYDINEKPSDPNQVFLDSNHSNFILVDDRVGKFGGEINFRSNLEAELRKGHPVSHYTAIFNRAKSNDFLKLIKKSSASSSGSNDTSDSGIVPTILIVVNGGPNTLKTVIEALDNKIPVVVLAVSVELNRKCQRLVQIKMALFLKKSKGGAGKQIDAFWPGCNLTFEKIAEQQI